MSLRARLLATVGALALLALLVADVVTYTSLRTVLYDQADSNLDAAHVGIEAALTGGGESPATSPPRRAGADAAGVTGSAEARRRAAAAGGDSTFCQQFGHYAPGAFVEVRSAGGAALSGDRCPAYEFGDDRPFYPVLPARIGGLHPGSHHAGELVTYFTAGSTTEGGPVFRVRASTLGAGAYAGDLLVIAEPFAAEHTLRDLALVEAAVTAAALAAALALGWWLVRLELAPLRRVESTAESIVGGDVSHRVPGENARTEVGQVARALNAMLARIEQAFAERDATESELRASEERLRRFVGDASHELRTPIAAISAYAELFERGLGQEEDLPRVVRGIRLESARMAQLVEDLLLLARLDEHRPLRRETVELVDLAAGAIETARTVGPDWPLRLEASDAVEVLGDRLQLRQVLDNLLANVRAHTPPGTAAAVRVRSGDGEAVIEVADDGPGMDPEQARRVFERFFRADPSRARQTGGAGLGLAIVNAIAVAHGGRASVRSAPGSGSTFEVRIPSAAPEPPAEDAAADARRRS